MKSNQVIWLQLLAFFIPGILLPFQNLVPTLPTMQHATERQDFIRLHCFFCSHKRLYINFFIFFFYICRSTPQDLWTHFDVYNWWSYPLTLQLLRAVLTFWWRCSTGLWSQWPVGEAPLCSWPHLVCGLADSASLQTRCTRFLCRPASENTNNVTDVGSFRDEFWLLFQCKNMKIKK